VPPARRQIRINRGNLNQNPSRTAQPNNFPRVANRDKASFLSEDVEFDEFVADINGSVAFAATKFPLQPGIAATFPKGSVKAALYSEWKQIGCEFYYKPEVSGFAANGSTGKVILALDYNAGNPAPTTKQQVEIMHRVDNMPYEAMSLRTDTQAVNRADAKYIRTGPIAPDEDIKTFDGGNLWVCTIGQASGALVGELHARYIFRCSKPTLLNPAQGGLLPTTAVSFYTQVAPTALVTTVPKAVQYDTAVVDGIGIGAPVAGVFTPPAGHYKVTAQVNYNDTASENFIANTQVWKNGAALALPSTQLVEMAATAAQEYASVFIQAFISCNGTDTVQIEADATGAAGVLTIPANLSNVCFESV